MLMEENEEEAVSDKLGDISLCCHHSSHTNQDIIKVEDITFKVLVLEFCTFLDLGKMYFL